MKYLILAILTTFLNQAFAFKRVGVFDSPTNIDHPIIHQHIDWDFMNNHFVKLGKEKLSLADLSRLCHQEEIKLANKEYKKLNKARSLYLSVNDYSCFNQNDEELSKLKILGQALGIMLSPKIRKDKKRLDGALSIYSYLNHGTAVTDAVIMQAKDDVKVTPFPASCGEIPFDSINQFNQIAQKANFTTVNISMGGSDEKIIESNRKSRGLLGRIFYGKKKKKKAVESWEEFRNQMENLVTSNPQSLFVFSSGNEAENVDHLTNTMLSVKNSGNLMIVGSINDPNKNPEVQKSNFSNYSIMGRKVDIAACGEKRRLANFEGGVSNNTGTSFSSPTIAGAVASFARDYPNLSGSELKEKFLSFDSKDRSGNRIFTNNFERGKVDRPYDRDYRILHKVDEGRYLADCNNRK
jgi:hypothetical protein